MIQERVPNLVYQLQILSAREQGLILAKTVLVNLGYSEADLIRSSDRAKFSLELFDEDKAKLSKVQKLFGRLELKSLRVSLKSLRPKDWLTRWKTQWQPAALTKDLDVVPVWHRRKYKAKPGREFILMDTLLSFGTGLHETTRFMARIIEDEAGRFESFLDIGTGTGILAMVALKGGARDVSAIDIGDLSVKAARDNMKVNGLRFHLKRADIKTYAPGRTFDFVAANLVTQDLITHGRKITVLVKKGGRLAVSGISLDNLGLLKRSFAALPLKCLKTVKGEQWSALLYQKKT